MSEKLTATLSWIEHRMQPILLAEYGSLRDQSLVTAVTENEAAIVALGEQGRRDLLILTDVRDAVITDESLQAFKSVARAMKPYTKASAVVGITTVRRALLSIVNLFSTLETRPFKDLSEAKDWLVEQADKGR